MLTKTQAQALAAKKALESGQSWTAVAKKYSIDPTTKNKGGVLTGVTKRQQDATLANSSFAAPVNKLMGPVKTQFGYYVIEVTKINPSTQRSLAQSTPLIKTQLSSQQQTSAQTAVENKAKKDWLSQTTCRAQYAMSDCKGYKAPKSATTTTPPTATTGRPRRIRRPPLKRSLGWTRSRAGCGGSVPGIASRTSARSCPTRLRSPTSSPTPRTVVTTPRCSTSSATCCSRSHFLALLLEERGAGDLARVATHVTDKLVRRHPHVFGDDRGRERPARSAGTGTRSSSASPAARPACSARCPRTCPRCCTPARCSGASPPPASTSPASRGRSSPCADELVELEAAGTEDERFHELGDLLFAVVNVARKLKIDPELALRAAADRFRARVQAGEQARSIRRRDSWNDLPPDEQLAYYARARLTEGGPRPE